MGNDFDLEHYFEISPDGICIAGHDGLCIRVNKAFALALGYSAEELVGKPICDLLYPEDLFRTNAAFERMKFNLTLTNFENRYVTKSGHIRWFSLDSDPYRKCTCNFRNSERRFPSAEA